MPRNQAAGRVRQNAWSYKAVASNRPLQWPPGARAHGTPWEPHGMCHGIVRPEMEGPPGSTLRDQGLPHSLAHPGYVPECREGTLRYPGLQPQPLGHQGQGVVEEWACLRGILHDTGAQQEDQEQGRDFLGSNGPISAQPASDQCPSLSPVGQSSHPLLRPEGGAQVRGGTN